MLSQAPKFVLNDAVDVFELSDSHRQKLTLDNNVDILRQAPLKKLKRLSLRAMAVLRLNESGFDWLKPA
jgi:hypothetical protein